MWTTLDQIVQLTWNGKIPWKTETIKPHTRIKIDNLSSLIYTKEYEFLVKTFHTNKTPELDGFTGEFYQALKDKSYQFFILYPRNLKREDYFLIHFIRQHYFDTKTRQKTLQEERLYRQAFLMDIDANILNKF